MTQKKHSAKKLDWKDIFESDTDGLRALVQQVVQEVLEAEMDEGAWYALRASESVLFRKDTSSLWRELIEQAGGGRAANNRELY